MQNCYPQVIEKSFEIIKHFEEKFGWFSIRVYQFPQIDGFGTFLESVQRTLLRHRTIGWYMWARIRGTVYFFCSWNPDVSAKWSKVQVREKQEKLDFDGMICKITGCRLKNSRSLRHIHPGLLICILPVSLIYDICLKNPYFRRGKCWKMDYLINLCFFLIFYAKR